MGGAVGAAPTNTGLQGNNGSQSVGMGGGLPMASPMDNAMAQFGGQQQNQQQNQQFNQAPPAGGFGSLGSLHQTAQNNPTSTEFSPFGSGDMSVMSDNGRLSGQGQQQSQQNSLETLQGQMSPFGAMPSQPNPYKQDFGFGGAYGQQAQSRMQSQYQPQQQQAPFQQQPQVQGLQQLLSRMLSGYQNRPQYGAQPSTAQPMPAYSSPALSYKPDYMRAQEALNRTATTQAEAQAAAAAKTVEAQTQTQDDQDFLRWQRQQYENSKYNYGG